MIFAVRWRTLSGGAHSKMKMGMISWMNLASLCVIAMLDSSAGLMEGVCDTCFLFGSLLFHLMLVFLACPFTLVMKSLTFTR